MKDPKAMGPLYRISWYNGPTVCSFPIPTFAIFLYRTLRCVIKFKDNTKIISYSHTQPYFIISFNLLATSFRR
jgi:hypothetical protein